MEYIPYNGYLIVFDGNEIYVAKNLDDKRCKKYYMVSADEAYEFIDDVLIKV